MLAGFFSILVHELGHALAGRKFGVRNPEIVLHGMGGVAIFPGARFTRKESFLTTFAGPGIQIILGIIAFVLSVRFADVPGLNNFLVTLCLISIFWAVLNLFPIIGIMTGLLLAITCLVLNIGLIAPFLFGYLAYQNYKGLQQV